MIDAFEIIGKPRQALENSKPVEEVIEEVIEEPQTFIALEDTPEKFKGNKGKMLVVDRKETGLIFKEIPKTKTIIQGGGGGRTEYAINLDGGIAGSFYGGINPIDGGNVNGC